MKETCVYSLTLTVAYNGGHDEMANITGQGNLHELLFVCAVLMFYLRLVIVKMKNTHGYLSSLDYPLWQVAVIVN